MNTEREQENRQTKLSNSSTGLGSTTNNDRSSLEMKGSSSQTAKLGREIELQTIAIDSTANKEPVDLNNNNYLESQTFEIIKSPEILMQTNSWNSHGNDNNNHPQQESARRTREGEKRVSLVKPELKQDGPDFQSCVFAAVMADDYDLVSAIINFIKLSEPVTREKKRALQLAKQLEEMSNLHALLKFENRVYQRYQDFCETITGLTFLTEDHQRELEQFYAEMVDEEVQERYQYFLARKPIRSNYHRDENVPELMRRQYEKQLRNKLTETNQKVGLTKSLSEIGEKLKELINKNKMDLEKLEKEQEDKGMEHLNITNEIAHNTRKNVEFIANDKKLNFPKEYRDPKYFAEKFLEADIDIDTTDEDGNSMLHHAMKHHCYRIIKLLLDKNANPHTKNRQGQNILEFSDLATATDNINQVTTMISNIVSKSSAFMKEVKKTLDNYSNGTYAKFGYKLDQKRGRADRKEEYTKLLRTYEKVLAHDLTDERMVNKILKVSKKADVKWFPIYSSGGWYYFGSWLHHPLLEAAEQCSKPNYARQDPLASKIQHLRPKKKKAETAVLFESAMIKIKSNRNLIIIEDLTKYAKEMKEGKEKTEKMCQEEKERRRQDTVRHGQENEELKRELRERDKQFEKKLEEKLEESKREAEKKLEEKLEESKREAEKKLEKQKEDFFELMKQSLAKQEEAFNKRFEAFERRGALVLEEPHREKGEENAQTSVLPEERALQTGTQSRSQVLGGSTSYERPVNLGLEGSVSTQTGRNEDTLNRGQGSSEGEKREEKREEEVSQGMENKN